MYYSYADKASDEDQTESYRLNIIEDFLCRFRHKKDPMEYAIKKFIRDIDYNFCNEQQRDLIFDFIPDRFYADKNFIEKISFYAKLMTGEFLYTDKYIKKYLTKEKNNK